MALAQRSHLITCREGSPAPCPSQTLSVLRAAPAPTPAHPLAILMPRRGYDGPHCDSSRSEGTGLSMIAPSYYQLCPTSKCQSLIQLKSYLAEKKKSNSRMGVGAIKHVGPWGPHQSAALNQQAGSLGPRPGSRSNAANSHRMGPRIRNRVAVAPSQGPGGRNL